MATIYRVTDRRGRGLYVSGLCRTLGLSGTANRRQPMPWQDGIPKPDIELRKHMRCGFRSYGQLRAWFKYQLHKVGNAQLRVYEVADNHVICGKHQVIFNKSRAKLKEIKEAGTWAH